jgi:hypothetical protein
VAAAVATAILVQVVVHLKQGKLGKKILYTTIGQKKKLIAPSGNRTQGSSMATTNFTTKPMVLVTATVGL